MDDQECTAKPGQSCKNGLELELLKKRVEDLEEGQNREIAFRKTYYEDREARIERDTRLDMKIKSMDEKLDKLLRWQDDQDNKPNKLVEGIKDKLIAGIVGAVAVGIVAAVLFLIQAVAG